MARVRELCSVQVAVTACVAVGSRGLGSDEEHEPSVVTGNMSSIASKEGGAVNTVDPADEALIGA